MEAVPPVRGVRVAHPTGCGLLRTRVRMTAEPPAIRLSLAGCAARAIAIHEIRDSPLVVEFVETGDRSVAR